MLICDTHADTLFTAAMRPENKRDVTLETLKMGGVNLQTLAMFVGGSSEIEAVRQCFDKMYKALDEFKASGWKQVLSPKDAKEGETAFLLSVEGCDLLYDGMDTIDKWYDMGVRMAALTWNHQNVVATPACVNDTDKLTLLPIWEGDKVFLRLLETRETFFSLKLVYDGERLARAVLDGKELAV